MHRYAEGRKAWGHCERCGMRYLLKQLTSDGYKPDLLVCQPCWDEDHPQERLPDTVDPIALYEPTGDLSLQDPLARPSPAPLFFTDPPIITLSGSMSEEGDSVSVFVAASKSPVALTFDWASPPPDGTTFTVNGNSVTLTAAPSSFSGSITVTATDGDGRVATEQIPVVIPELVYTTTYFASGNWFTSQFSDPLMIDGYRDPDAFDASVIGSQNDQSQSWIDRDSESVGNYHLFIRNQTANTYHGFKAQLRPEGTASRTVGNSPYQWSRKDFSVVNEVGEPDLSARLDGTVTPWFVASGNGIYVTCPHTPAFGTSVAAHTCPIDGSVLSRNLPDLFPIAAHTYQGVLISYLPTRGRFYAVVGRKNSGTNFIATLMFCSTSDGVSWTLDQEIDAPADHHFAVFDWANEYKEGCLCFAARVRGSTDFDYDSSDIFWMDDLGDWQRSSRAYTSSFGSAACLTPDGFYVGSGGSLLRFADITDITSPLETIAADTGVPLWGALVTVNSIAYNPQDPSRMIVTGLKSESPYPVLALSFDFATKSFTRYSQPANYASSVTQMIVPKVYSG